MMRARFSTALIGLALASADAAAQVLQCSELTTARLDALNRPRTVVFVPRAMLEEHGPYLPAGTNAILTQRLTDALADALPRHRRGAPSSSDRGVRSSRFGGGAASEGHGQG